MQVIVKIKKGRAHYVGTGMFITEIVYIINLLSTYIALMTSYFKVTFS